VDRKQWIKIEELLQQALDLEPDKRAGFLERCCGGDAALLAEVTALLGRETDARSFMESPAVNQWFHSRADPPSQISHYRIENRAGSGGMGEVFKAHDEKLRRTVALKLLPVEFTSDPQRVRRFEQEALAASRLNHPNIVTIFEITQAAETHLIVEEFVDGRTLRDLLPATSSQTQRPLGLEQALDIAIQIARALKAAHTAWIIHRDIKPENIMIRDDGLVKVLDFGIAKLVDEFDAPGRQDHSLPDAVKDPSLTTPGAIMGTASYMSPEQARGEALDGRTDLFSLGTLLYEMVTGVQLFAGSLSSDVTERLQRADEIVRSRLGQAPKQLQPILRRALKSDREERYSSAGEFLDDLIALKALLESRTTRRIVRLSAVSVVVAVGLAAVAAFLSITETWEETIFRDGHTAAVRRAVFSPDGKLLVSGGEDQQVIVWDFTRRMRLKNLSGHNGTVTTIAFSPDGKWFVSGGEDQTVILWNAERLEKEVVWHDRPNAVYAACFSPDSALLAYGVGPVIVVRETKTWTKVKEILRSVTAYGNLIFRRNGRQLVDSGGSVWNLDSGELIIDSPSEWEANWIAPAHDGKRWASVDPGGYLHILDLDQQRSFFSQIVHHDHGRSLAYSPDGKLLATAAERILLWDAATMMKITPLEYESIVWSVDFSPDGRWLVSTHGDGSILIWDVLNRELEADLRQHSGAVRSIAFSHDAMRVATASDDHSVILWNTADGTKKAVLNAHETRVGAVTFAPEDRWLVSGDQLGRMNQFKVDQADATTFAAPKVPLPAYFLTVSPDSRFIATSFAVYNAETREVLLRSGVSDWGNVYGAVFTPDGLLLVGVTVYGEVLMYDTRDWQLLERQKWTASPLVTLSLAPDGNHIVTGEDARVIRLGTIRPLKQLSVIGQHTARVKAVAFSPDGTEVASAGDDRMVALWDVRRRKLITTIGTHTAPVYALAFSPDGRRLLTGGHDRSVRQYTRHRTLWGFFFD
jgi:WD40 repeat protein